MKRKLMALVLALSSVFTVTAQAVQVNFSKSDETRAVIVCYDGNGKLCYSSLAKSENGSFTADIPSQYNGFTKKAYFVKSGEIIAVSEVLPSPSAEPTQTPNPAPTSTPSTHHHDYPSVYEKEVDSLYGMALVKDVESDINANGESVYAVTVFYNGMEIKVDIAEDLKITSAPEAQKELEGMSADSLKRGDVITMTANITGDRIKTLDLLMRPTDTDIATGTADYGANFEKLFTDQGKVAGKWSYITYTAKAPSDRYCYAFGIVAKKKNASLMLINKNASENEIIDLDIRPDTLVYTCDVTGREYTLEIDDIGGIETTLPNSMFDRDEPFVLDDTYSYNYALARVVDGVTTEIILFNNYNE